MKIHALRKSARGDDAARRVAAHAFTSVCEPSESTTADQRSVCSGFPGSARCRAVDNVGRAQFAEVRRGVRLAGGCGHAESGRREQHDGHAAHAAGRARDEDRPVCWTDAVPFDRDHGKRRRVSRRADRHRLEQRHRLWFAEEPVASGRRTFREAAPVRFTKAPSVDDDRRAGRPPWVIARPHGTRQVDAGNHREGSDNGRAVHDRERVLVVHCRMRDVDDDRSLHPHERAKRRRGREPTRDGPRQSWLSR